MLRQFSTRIAIRPDGPGLHQFTADVGEFVARSDISEGLLTIFCRHTSASLLIHENAAPGARRDTERFFAKIAPRDTDYEHDDEGPDDMPAHLRTALTQTHLSVPVSHGALVLGTWQGIFLFEHRDRPGRREIAMHLIGE